MTSRAERAQEITRRLKRMYPRAVCTLDYETPLQLLIATILSAQSTDARVNIVTKALFRKYKSAAAFAAAKLPELERDIHATGFFRNKSKSVVGAATRIVEKHGGEVPATMEELIELPGVGRKTANVVLGNAFGISEGVVVDTHVTRVSGRLALTENTDAVKIENDLKELIPRKEWTKFSHRLILHGRTICIARKPKCSECLLNELCPSAREPLE
ncbi:MAG TPA: endonuclease III [Thermoanaerobaculia bacterium]|nr:endonuclease III [Thermoanaerobaculia bacterium]